MAAIISGDLINSSMYAPDDLRSILEILKKEFQQIEKQFSDTAIFFELYRGDSFQGIVEDSSLALAIALQIKSAVNKYSKNEDAKNASPIADIRISIGLGEVTYIENALAESNGAAFQYSGRTLDTMKSQEMKIALTTKDQDINSEFKVHLKFLDALTDRWSIASAEVVYYLLRNYKEQEIARKVSRSQAAINQRKKAAGWEEIKLLLDRYKQVTKKHFA